MNNAGRKPKYPTTLLLDRLAEYVDLHPNLIIKYSNLEKFSKIPRHIWRDNPKLNTVIKKLNTPEIIIDTQNMILGLPSADDILLHYNNRKKLEKTISDLLNLAATLYEKAIKGENFEKIELNYKLEIEELKACYDSQLQKANSEIIKLNKEIDELYLDSRNDLTRKQKGLKSNMIEISKYKENSLSKNIKDLKKEFSSLFD